MADAWDQAWQQATGKVKPQSDPTQPTEQTDPNKPAKRLDRQQITAQEEQQAGTEQSPSAGDYLWDGAVGVAAGAEGFAKSVGKLTNDVAGAVGLKFADDSTFDSSIHTKTWVGGLTSGLTQFALAFLPAVGVAGRIGEAVGITSKLAQGLAAGGIADFVGFDEKQQKLSNLIEQVPMLKNPITDFLSSKENDGFALGRLKNAIEGAGMALIVHPFMEALKGFKGQLAAKLAGNSEEVNKIAQTTAKKVADAMEKVNKSAAAAKASTATQEIANGERANLTPTAKDIAKKSLNDPELDSLAKKVVDHLTTSDAPYDTAIDEAVQTHVNYDRLVTSKEVEGLQKFSQKIADEYVQRITQGKVSLDLVEDTANELAETFGENPKLLTAAAASDTQAIQGVGVRLVSYRIMRNTIGRSIVDAADRIASGMADDSVAEMNRLTTLSKEYMNLHKQVQVIQKEGARIPSFGRVVADGLVGSYDSDELAKAIEKTMGGANGKVAQQQMVRTILASKADPKSMLTLFDGLVKRGSGKAMGILNEFHVNSILSSLTTMSTKFLSDLTNSVVLPTERIIGGAWQQNKSVMQSGGRMFLNIMQSFGDWMHIAGDAGNISERYGSSVGRAYQAFLTGQPILDHLTEFEPAKNISARNVGLSDNSLVGHAVNYLGNVVRLPQRMLVGMDEFWKSVNYKAYVRDEGIRLSQQAGLTAPDEIAQFVNNHITQSFTGSGSAANEAALNYAKTSTFQNDLLPGTIGKWVQNGVTEHPALRMIMPFVKTPTNIFRRAFQMTPGLNLLQDEFRQMLNHPDATVRAEALGRMSLGGMMWTLGIGLASTNKLTGGGPSPSAERNNQLDAGWQPYSVVTTGPDGKKSYISFKKMEPFAYFLGLVADWKEAVGQMHDDDSEKIGQGMVYALAHNLSSKTYLTGLTEVINALSQPDKNVQHFVNGFAGSFIPAALAKANNDDYMHEARTMMDAVMRRIPGLSGTLPPNRNILGEPVKVPQGYLPFGAEGTALARQVSPFAFSQQTDDKTKQALADLQYGFKKAPKSYQRFDLSSFHNAQGQDAYDRFQELHGQVQISGKGLGQSLTDLINSQRYGAMPKPDMHGDDTNPRIQAVNSIISAYREHAMAETLREFPGIHNAIRQYANQNRTAGPLSALATR